MPTKGPSMRYGNTRGANHRGYISKSISYAWAKDFNRGGLSRHYGEHGKELGLNSENEYASKAVHFANSVDRNNYKSYVDCYGTTYKYNTRTNELVIVTKDGYVVSYYKVRNNFWYYVKKGEKRWIKI